MISTLINLLGSFYERKEFTKAEAIARNMHTAIPGDRVSLKFLGLVYFRTGRINEAIRLFDELERQPNISAEKQATAPADSAVVACAREATLRVPYLAQAWRDLGKALAKLRNFQSTQQSRQGSAFSGQVLA